MRKSSETCEGARTNALWPTGERKAPRRKPRLPSPGLQRRRSLAGSPPLLLEHRVHRSVFLLASRTSYRLVRPGISYTSLSIMGCCRAAGEHHFRRSVFLAASRERMAWTRLVRLGAGAVPATVPGRPGNVRLQSSFVDQPPRHHGRLGSAIRSCKTPDVPGRFISPR